MGNAPGGGVGRDGAGEGAALLPAHRQGNAEAGAAEELRLPLLTPPPPPPSHPTQPLTSPLSAPTSRSGISVYRMDEGRGREAKARLTAAMDAAYEEVKEEGGEEEKQRSTAQSTATAASAPTASTSSPASALQRGARPTGRASRSLVLALAAVPPTSSSPSSTPSTSSSPYASTSPLELWVSIFSYLSQADLARAAAVSRRWAVSAYDPLLWTSIHLCHRYHKVDDEVVALLLSSSRFPRLAHLCLDRCSAITDVTLGYVQAYCPHLQHLSVVQCHRLTREGVLAYIAGSEVVKVELMGAMGGWSEVVSGLAEMGREVDLGFFLLEWMAKEGVRLKRRRRWSLTQLPYFPQPSTVNEQQPQQLMGGDGEEEEKATTQQLQPQQPPLSAVAGAGPGRPPANAPLTSAVAVAAPAGGPLFAAARGGAAGVGVGAGRVGGVEVVRAACRHSRSVADNPSASACWGEVSGRLVLSSGVYHVPGNYPVQVLYSCEQHSDTDLSDARYHRCQVCEQLFVPASMYSEVVCNFCYDSENLSRRHHWIALTPTAIREFGLSEVVGKTIRIAERKNLPITLLSFNTTPCNLDYSLPLPAQDDADDDTGGGDSAHSTLIDDHQRKQNAEEEEKQRIGERAEDEGEDADEGDGDGAALDRDEGEGGEEKAETEGGRTRARSRRRSRTGQPRQSAVTAVTAVTAATSSSSSSAGSALPLSPSSLPLPTSSTALLSSAPSLDPTRVPLTLFLSHNASRLDRTVEGLQSHLRKAYSRGCTRALLVLDEEENIEVLADSRVIADGLEGESHLKLVALIWHQLLLLLYSLLLLVLLSAYYRDAFNRLLYGVPISNPHPSRLQFITDPHLLDGLNWGLLSAILAFVFVLLIALVVLFRRYRRYFEVIFRKFLALDIFAIYSFGTLCITATTAMLTHTPLDALTLALITLNVALLAVYTLYYDVSVGLHTLSVVYLNAIMAVLLSGALAGPLAFWLPFVLCLVVAVLDLELRPQLRLPPLLVPESMIIPSKPTILLCLNSVYVRPGELTLYGLMVTLVGAFNVLTVIGVVGLWVLLVCALPFVSGSRRWRRPLPFMLAYCAVLWWKYDQNISPARFRWSSLST